MKRLLASAFALALLGAAAPALAQYDNHYDRHDHQRYDRYRDRGAYARRDYDYYAWQRMQNRRYRYYHGRQVTYYNGAWGYWAPQNGLHVFISVPL
jgi:hypothetical protein